MARITVLCYFLFHPTWNSICQKCSNLLLVLLYLLQITTISFAFLKGYDSVFNYFRLCDRNTVTF